MRDALPIPADPPSGPPEPWTRPFVLRQLQLLGELAEIGLDIARHVERQARPDPEAPDSQKQGKPAAPGEIALAYARVSRSVRLTIQLQSRLIEAEKPQMEEAEERARRLDPVYNRKARVERVVERLIEAEYPEDEERVDALLIEAGDRLDDEDLYGDLMDRPMSEIVARICKDLGVEPDWAELSGEFWARKEAEAGQPGWPLARLPQGSGRKGLPPPLIPDDS